jgi:hypothetical protein
VPNSRAKAKLLAQVQVLARQLEQLEAVEKVTVFDAIAFAPPSAYVKQRQDSVRIPRFDLVVLIEAKSPAIARTVQQTPEYQTLLETLSNQVKQMHIIVARDAKRIGEVDKTRKGVFLFNYFVGDDARTTLELWDYLAGWYTVETGLDNSTLLVPLEGEPSDYVAINHARWDGSLPGVLLAQLSKKSFRTYLLANLEANQVGAMPVLYRLADSARQSTGTALAWTLAVGLAAMGAGFALLRLAPRRQKKQALLPGRARAGRMLRRMVPRMLKTSSKRRR